MTKKKSRVTRERVLLIFDKRRKGYSCKDVGIIAGVSASQVSTIMSVGEALKDEDLETAVYLLGLDRSERLTGFATAKIGWICEAEGIEAPSREQIKTAIDNLKNSDTAQCDQPETLFDFSYLDESTPNNQEILDRLDRIIALLEGVTNANHH